MNTNVNTNMNTNTNMNMNMNTLLTNVAVPITVLDDTLKIGLWNPMMEQLTGKKVYEILGKTFMEVIINDVNLKSVISEKIVENRKSLEEFLKGILSGGFPFLNENGNQDISFSIPSLNKDGNGSVYTVDGNGRPYTVELSYFMPETETTSNYIITSNYMPDNNSNKRRFQIKITKIQTVGMDVGTDVDYDRARLVCVVEDITDLGQINTYCREYPREYRRAVSIATELLGILQMYKGLQYRPIIGSLNSSSNLLLSQQIQSLSPPQQILQTSLQQIRRQQSDEMANLDREMVLQTQQSNTMSHMSNQSNEMSRQSNQSNEMSRLSSETFNQSNEMSHQSYEMSRDSNQVPLLSNEIFDSQSSNHDFTLLHKCRSPCFAFDQNRIIRFWNQAMGRLTGSVGRNVVGQKIERFLSLNKRLLEVLESDQSSTKKEQQRLTILGQSKEGKARQKIELLVSLTDISFDSVAGILIVGQDITNLLRQTPPGNTNVNIFNNNTNVERRREDKSVVLLPKCGKSPDESEQKGEFNLSSPATNGIITSGKGGSKDTAVQRVKRNRNRNSGNKSSGKGDNSERSFRGNSKRSSSNSQLLEMNMSSSESMSGSHSREETVDYTKDSWGSSNSDSVITDLSYDKTTQPSAVAAATSNLNAVPIAPTVPASLNGSEKRGDSTSSKRGDSRGSTSRKPVQKKYINAATSLNIGTVITTGNENKHHSATSTHAAPNEKKHHSATSTHAVAHAEFSHTTHNEDGKAQALIVEKNEAPKGEFFPSTGIRLNEHNQKDKRENVYVPHLDTTAGAEIKGQQDLSKGGEYESNAYVKGKGGMIVEKGKENKEPREEIITIAGQTIIVASDGLLVQKKSSADSAAGWGIFNGEEGSFSRSSGERDELERRNTIRENRGKNSSSKQYIGGKTKSVFLGQEIISAAGQDKDGNAILYAENRENFMSSNVTSLDNEAYRKGANALGNKVIKGSNAAALSSNAAQFMTSMLNSFTDEGKDFQSEVEKGYKGAKGVENIVLGGEAAKIEVKGFSAGFSADVKGDSKSKGEPSSLSSSGTTGLLLGTTNAAGGLPNSSLGGRDGLGAVLTEKDGKIPTLTPGVGKNLPSSSKEIIAGIRLVGGAADSSTTGSTRSKPFTAGHGIIEATIDEKNVLIGGAMGGSKRRGSLGTNILSGALDGMAQKPATSIISGELDMKGSILDIIGSGKMASSRFSGKGKDQLPENNNGTNNGGPNNDGTSNETSNGTGKNPQEVAVDQGKAGAYWTVGENSILAPNMKPTFTLKTIFVRKPGEAPKILSKFGGVRTSVSGSGKADEVPGKADEIVPPQAKVRIPFYDQVLLKGLSIADGSATAQVLKNTGGEEGIAEGEVRGGNPGVGNMSQKVENQDLSGSGAGVTTIGRTVSQTSISKPAFFQQNLTNDLANLNLPPSLQPVLQQNQQQQAMAALNQQQQAMLQAMPLMNEQQPMSHPNQGKQKSMPKGMQATQPSMPIGIMQRNAQPIQPKMPMQQMVPQSLQQENAQGYNTSSSIRQQPQSSNLPGYHPDLNHSDEGFQSKVSQLSLVSLSSSNQKEKLKASTLYNMEEVQRAMRATEKGHKEA